MIIDNITQDPHYRMDATTPSGPSDPKVLLRRIQKQERDRLISARIGILQDDLFRLFGAKKILG